MSTVFRVEKTANYTVMSNTHLKDRRLSYKSKGLLSVILSLPPDWDYTITGLASEQGNGAMERTARSISRSYRKIRYCGKPRLGRNGYRAA